MSENLDAINAGNNVTVPENLFSADKPLDIFDEIVAEDLGIPVNQEKQQQPKSDTEESKQDDVISQLLDDKEAMSPEDVINTVIENKGTLSIKTIEKLIDEGLMLPFDEDKKLEDYTDEDIYDLIKANIEEIRNTVQNEAINKFIEGLPNELQLLTKYVNEGGTDVKRILEYIQKASDISKLDVDKDAELIVRMYLEHTNFGDEDEIEEHIELLKSGGKLNDYAVKYKEKLNSMQESIIDKEIKKQQEIKEKQEKFASNYIQEVNKALQDRTLNGMTISSKKKEELIDALTQVKYDSVNGHKTTKLGHLLEKRQFIEPDLKLIAEVVWLLDNPEEYKNFIMEKGKQQAMAESKKLLKAANDKSNRNSNVNLNINENVIVKKKHEDDNIASKFFSR